jgi:hypothetical protein
VTSGAGLYSIAPAAERRLPGGRSAGILPARFFLVILHLEFPLPGAKTTLTNRREQLLDSSTLTALDQQRVPARLQFLPSLHFRRPPPSPNETDKMAHHHTFAGPIFGA